MRNLAAVVTAPVITSWMPKGRRCRVEDIIQPDYIPPQSAEEVRAYMAQHLAGRGGR